VAWVHLKIGFFKVYRLREVHDLLSGLHPGFDHDAVQRLEIIEHKLEWVRQTRRAREEARANLVFAPLLLTQVCSQRFSSTLRKLNSNISIPIPPLFVSTRSTRRWLRICDSQPT
jgi:hypothetical protein